MKNIFILVILTISLISCSNKNYQTIENIKETYNSSNDNIIVLNLKKFNPTKKIFRKLNSELSNDYVYIFTWINHMPINSIHFSALVFDRKSNRYFYIGNTFEDVGTISMYNSENDYKEEKKILNYYLEGRINDLMGLAPVLKSAGSEYYIFDSTLNKAYIVENITLDN